MAHMMILDDGGAGAADELAQPLRHERHRVTCVRCADEAVSHLNDDMPDLIVVPVPMLGRPAAPLIGELADRRDRPLPSVAFYWSKIEETELGGPTPFGSCWYVARGVSWDQTYERLMGCIGQPSPLHLLRAEIIPQSFQKYVA